MTIQRPNLSSVDPSVLLYIESLEHELELLRSQPHSEDREIDTSLQEPAEPPTTISVISATSRGNAKRTLRHLYPRQRRGGIGIYDLDDPDDQPPAILTLADIDQTLLLITNLGRAFQLAVTSIPETAVRGRASMVIEKLNLADDEHLAAILPIQAQGYLAVLSERGMVRLLRHHVFGEYMKPGMALYDPKSFGTIAAACWSPGECDLFIATRQGRGIRFAGKLVPPQGCLAIRLTEDDAPIAIAAVYENSGVFLLGADGRGTIRDMRGFNPNKAPGAGGKAAMVSDRLVSAAAVQSNDDIFIISNLSKIIRFRADEVPVKEGVVQGVNCMAFRADSAVALAVSINK